MESGARAGREPQRGREQRIVGDARRQRHRGSGTQFRGLFSKSGNQAEGDEKG